MSIEFFHNVLGHTVMADTNSETAFGPIFGEDEDPQVFIDWYKDNGFRSQPAETIKRDRLAWLVDKWRKEVKENKKEKESK